ncbi:MAG: NTP transferase domain-containing protein [Alphaproteobacteria bacterium]|nr:NTP transferase domain-containing protein [Alphaproteobacteria bacterium]
MSSSNNFIVVIMAGGLGKRMNSNLPKVLHQIRGKPMLVHIIEEALLIQPKKIYVIVGKFRDIIQKTVEKYINSKLIEYIDQPEPLGTGHAIQCAKPKLLRHPDSKVLILSGDVPFIKSTTMLKMLECDKVKLMTTLVDKPTGYGRIIRHITNNQFEKIVEEKDCNQIEKQVNEINCGIYTFESNILCWNLQFLKNNNSQLEYYLTDIFEIIKENDEKINIETMEISKANQYQILGVNTIEQLEELERIAITY